MASFQSSNRRVQLHTNHTVPYGTALFGVALSQALRARLRSHRPYGTSQQALARALPGISGKTQLRKAERLQHIFCSHRSAIAIEISLELSDSCNSCTPV